MFKTIAFVVMLSSSLAFSQQAIARPSGEEADYNTPNPTGSKEINEGAAQQRKEYIERQGQENNKSTNTDPEGQDRSESDAGHKETNPERDVEIGQSTYKTRGTKP